jgi:hypothetical protein
MSKMLENAIAKIRELPEEIQDEAAAQLMEYVDEIPTLSERAAIAEGRAAVERGEYVTLDQWEHEMGLDHK